MLLFGVGKKDASLKASKAQAKEAVQRLITLSKEHDHVVLVGHGGMNWLMSRVLIKEGWKLEGKGSHANWGTIVLKPFNISCL
jgi:broad specificity phosphatase PhoE